MSDENEKLSIPQQEAEHFLETAEPLPPEKGEVRPVPERHSSTPTEKEDGSAPAISPLAQTLPRPVTQEKTELRLDIERVLEEDLSYMYSQLSSEQRKQFRDEGERLAGKLETMVASAKIKLRTVILMIREWLLLVPGINKFFVERAAKIKAEKILSLKDLDI